MVGRLRDHLVPGGETLPLVRATRSQLEVTLLPPYGDPEVDIPGEVATYLVVGALAAELLSRLSE